MHGRSWPFSLQGRNESKRVELRGVRRVAGTCLRPRPAPGPWMDPSFGCVPREGRPGWSKQLPLPQEHLLFLQRCQELAGRGAAGCGRGPPVVLGRGGAGLGQKEPSQCDSEAEAIVGLVGHRPNECPSFPFLGKLDQFYFSA